MKKRREKYAELATLHGLSLILSSKLNARPGNRRIINVQKRLQNLTKEMIKSLKSNSEPRKQQMNRLIMDKKMGTNEFINENELLKNILKKVDNDQNEDIAHGINALKFVADQCIRYNRDASDLKTFVC